MANECERWAAHFGPAHATGKKALKRRDRAALDPEVECSVALDDWGKDRWPRDARWDYALKGSAGCLAVEIHPATAGEVTRMVSKQCWARERLSEAGSKVGQWWWVPSGRNSIPSTGSARRRLAAVGIQVASRPLDKSQVRKRR